MRFAKTIALALLLAACPSAARAQQQQPACTVRRDAAPELRGFRLGMTEAEVRARVPGASVNRDLIGQGSVAFDYNQLKALDAAAYAGVGYVTLLFVGDRVTSVSVQYDQTVNWKSPAQFAERVSELLKLPKAWRPVDPQPREGHLPANNNAFLTMTCDGFLLTVTPNFIRLLDADHERALERLRDEFDSKKQQTFRP